MPATAYRLLNYRIILHNVKSKHIRGEPLTALCCYTTTGRKCVVSNWISLKLGTLVRCHPWRWQLCGNSLPIKSGMADDAQRWMGLNWHNSAAEWSIAFKFGTYVHYDSKKEAELWNL